ncbi:MAG: S-layer homology domain-containing protein, partial [Clostridia bacterium]|nr:S-layer homology domain-containing protein [Clostridia bacterium]
MTPFLTGGFLVFKNESVIGRIFACLSYEKAIFQRRNRMKNVIRLISLILAVFMIFPVFSFAEENAIPFSDVKEGDWFYGNVKYVYESGIMNG